jgi:DNA-binding Lrp family transcriptional regulator
MKLTDKDHTIIAILREDSRISLRALARQAKLRPSTVHDRLKRMQKSGIIEKFTLKLNNAAVGESFIVLMLVSGKPTQYIRDEMLKDKHVKEVFGITGEYDIMMKLKFKDVVEFNDFVLNFRKKNKDVQKTLTMVATKTLKEEI